MWVTSGLPKTIRTEPSDAISDWHRGRFNEWAIIRHRDLAIWDGGASTMRLSRAVLIQADAPGNDQKQCVAGEPESRYNQAKFVTK